jgi:hypothetical protein
MNTKEKLARALIEANAPQSMVNKARAGYYDDFESPIATPLQSLVLDLQAAKLHELAARAMNGDFDATPEEADMWYQREGKELFK